MHPHGGSAGQGAQRKTPKYDAEGERDPEKDRGRRNGARICTMVQQGKPRLAEFRAFRSSHSPIEQAAVAEVKLD